MLNSALGVTLPPPSESTSNAPPMIASFFTFGAKPGSWRMAVATLVSGPSAMMVTSPGFSFTTRIMKSTALSFSACFLANPPGGVGGASSDHHFPWTVVSHWVFSWTSGRFAPR